MEAQRIIITGGATRIGAAIAEKLSGPNKQILIQYNKSKSKAENLRKKLQSFGSKKSQILIVGLAPGLKGANRTGRPFTGDYAGDVLYPLLLKNNLASGKFDKNGSDNLVLKNCRITNSVRCVPPKNKPTNEEINICNAFLTSEINNLRDLKIILTLGRIAHIAVLKSLKLKNSKYTFGHDKVHKVENYIIINSYHCSKYNIFTPLYTHLYIFF